MCIIVIKTNKLNIGILLFSLFTMEKAIGQNGVPCNNPNDYTVVYLSQPPCDDNPFVLVFDEEFNGNSIDLTKWDPSGIATSTEPIDLTVSQAWFDPANVEVSNGTCKLWATHVAPFTETYGYPISYTNTFSYKSGIIWSNYNFGPGIYEISCKLPKGKSFWPAYWLWGPNPSTGITSEVDCFEFWNEPVNGTYNPNLLTQEDNMTTHYDNYNCQTTYNNGTTFADGNWHTFDIIWDDNGLLSWVVDGTIERTDYFLYDEESGAGTAICDVQTGFNDPYLVNTFFPSTPLNIISDFALQGGNKGPDGNTPFPSSLEIDYIKYWGRGTCSGTTTVSQSELYGGGAWNFFTGANIIVAPDVTVPTGTALSLIAQNSINIGSGFSSGGGALIVKTTNTCNEFGYERTTGIRNKTLSSFNQISGDSIKPENDSLNCIIKQSATRGLFYVGLNNISSNELNQTAIVTVYTMLGQPIFNGSMVVEENNVLAIDLSTQARGLYLIIIRTTDQVIHKKVVLQ